MGYRMNGLYIMKSPFTEILSWNFINKWEKVLYIENSSYFCIHQVREKIDSSFIPKGKAIFLKPNLILFNVIMYDGVYEF